MTCGTLIRKGFVRTGDRLVHFRMAGSGPPVVLLHDSPRSSLLHLPLLKALSDEFSIIALDTPGYGHSDALPNDPVPEIEDFGDALLEVLAELHLERPTIYAYHTSSKIALACAAKHPGKIGSMVIDGLSLPAERASHEFIARYMKPFEISDDGSYIAQQWTKARDIHRFFPWFERLAATRLPMEMPKPEALHTYAMDLFMAGKDFSSAYGAAMRFMALPIVKALSTPTVFMARANDVLYPFLDVLQPHLPENCRIERLSGEDAEWRSALVRNFRTAAQGNPNYTFPSASGAALPRGYQYHGHGDLLVERAGLGGARMPVIILHDSPGCGSDVRPLAAELARERPVFAPDLPGCGLSDPLPQPKAEAYANILVALADREGLSRFDVVASLLSTPLAVALADRHPDRVRKVVLDGAIVLTPDQRREFAERYCPPIEMTREGNHFLAMWHQLRDRELSWPWYEGSLQAMRTIEPDLHPIALHERLIAVMQQPQNYGDACKAAIEFDMIAGLASVQAPVLFLMDDDPAYSSVSQAVTHARSAQTVERPPGLPARASAIREFLDD